ncbi:MAG: Pr6Pr family membrane protein [Candidatus Hodarchaeota archaeon]
MTERKLNVWNKISLVTRIAILVLGAIALTFTFINMFKNNNFVSFRYYTIQSNLLVLAWVAISIPLVFREKKWFFHSILHSAVVLVITITLIIFAILLDPLYNPTAINEIINNILLHYLIPSLAIFDFLVSNNEAEIKYRYVPFWLIYPVCYLVFAVLHGNATGNYIYYFFDFGSIGMGIFVIMVIILAAMYILIGLLFAFINKKLRNRKTSKE